MLLVKLKQGKSFMGKRERALIDSAGARMEGRRHSINKAERGGERRNWRICGKMGKKYGRIS